VTTDDIACSAAGCGSAAFDGPPEEDFQRAIIQSACRSTLQMISLSLPGHKDLLQQMLVHLLLILNIIASQSTNTSGLRYASKGFKECPKIISTMTKSSGLRGSRYGGNSF
jgi:hypothetical protein